MFGVDTDFGAKANINVYAFFKVDGWVITCTLKLYVCLSGKFVYHIVLKMYEVEIKMEE